VTTDVVAHGEGGDDRFLGGGGPDKFYGNDGNDILVGGAGDDYLNGGDNRDLLIGGPGEDWLFGGDDADLLIGGATMYDANVGELRNILDFWARDLGYQTRVDALRSGEWGTGSRPLTTSTVFNDKATDYLAGNSGRDWFWDTIGGDILADRDWISERVN
jgi:Ca2+-binding RTX toxin-like protein